MTSSNKSLAETHPTLFNSLVDKEKEAVMLFDDVQLFNPKEVQSFTVDIEKHQKALKHQVNLFNIADINYKEEREKVVRLQKEHELELHQRTVAALKEGFVSGQKQTLDEVKELLKKLSGQQIMMLPENRTIEVVSYNQGIMDCIKIINRELGLGEQKNE